MLNFTFHDDRLCRQFPLHCQQQSYWHLQLGKPFLWPPLVWTYCIPAPCSPTKTGFCYYAVILLLLVWVGFFYNWFMNITWGSRGGRWNHLTQSQDFGFFIRLCEKLQCHKPGCSCHPQCCLSHIWDWQEGTGLFCIILNQPDMTGENLKSNGAETKGNTLMVTFASLRL